MRERCEHSFAPFWIFELPCLSPVKRIECQPCEREVRKREVLSKGGNRECRALGWWGGCTGDGIRREKNGTEWLCSVPNKLLHFLKKLMELKGLGELAGFGVHPVQRVIR